MAINEWKVSEPVLLRAESEKKSNHCGFARFISETNP